MKTTKKAYQLIYYSYVFLHTKHIAKVESTRGVQTCAKADHIMHPQINRWYHAGCNMGVWRHLVITHQN